MDLKHKLIRRYQVTDAAVHDSHAVDQLLTGGGSGVAADFAYRWTEIEATLKAMKLNSHIHHKGQRGKPLA